MKGLRAARHAAGLSQEALAARSGVTTSTIERLERGSHSPRLDTAEAIAAALEVPLAKLLEEPKPAAVR